MSSVIKYLFSRNTPAQFVGFKALPEQVSERVILKSGTKETDITNSHCIVCQTPMHIAVLFDQDNAILLEHGDCEVLVVGKDGKISQTRLVFVQQLQAESKIIALFRTTEALYYKLNPLVQDILLKRFDNKDRHTLAELKIQLALYSYPRSISVISFKDNEYFNMFPMNFQRYIAGSGLHLFGLRTTNITLKKILAERKILVSEPGDIDFKMVYALGSHHSKSPPKISGLPFAVTESELFKFPVPDFAVSYKEIEVVANFLLGSHMFFAGRVVNIKEAQTITPSLYNLHLFPFERSNYIEER